MTKVHLRLYSHTRVSRHLDLPDVEVFGPACRCGRGAPYDLSAKWEEVTCGNCRRIMERIAREEN